MDGSAGKDTSKEGCRRDHISLRFSAWADGRGCHLLLAAKRLAA